MPSGFGMQRLVVFNYIEQLPADEMKRAYKLYAVLNKIEWLSFVPFYFGMFAIIVLIFLTVLTDGKLPGGKDAMSLYGFGNAALFCAAGVLILKKLIFNPRRNGKVEELRTILSSDHNYRSTLEMLKQLDPDMIKNIRKYITHMPLEELSG